VAQSPREAQPQRGGTYTPPPASVDPIYTPRGPDQPADRFEEPVLRLQLTADLPLRSRASGTGAQGSAAPVSPTLQATLRWRPLEDRGWFAQLSLLRYVQPSRQQPWNPDFVYAFGYDDGEPGRWSFQYANYTGTRLSPDRALGEHRFNFPQGQWTARYRFGLPEPLEPVFLAGDGDRALCHAEGNLVPRYSQATSPALGENKVSLGLGCRYTRPDGWFAHATAFAWPHGRQQPWDPDYVWGFGWNSPGGITVQYANYTGNRWPGRSGTAGEGGFGNGSISVTWATAW
jgi:hypothetical protein